MKTDTIFYTLLQNLPSVLFELLEQPPTLALHYEFSSVEIKELARRIDGLFLPKPEYPQDPIYFVEVQFQSDDNLYWRLITEAFLYLNQFGGFISSNLPFTSSYLKPSPSSWFKYS